MRPNQGQRTIMRNKRLVIKLSDPQVEEGETYPIGAAVGEGAVSLIENEGLAASVLHRDHRSVLCRIHIEQRPDILAVIKQGIRDNMALIRIWSSPRWVEAVRVACVFTCQHTEIKDNYRFGDYIVHRKHCCFGEAGSRHPKTKGCRRTALLRRGRSCLCRCR